MKNRITAFLLAAAMMAPAASLWAAAGDSTLQGTSGTTNGTTLPKGKTKTHHGRHHKKAPAPAVTPTPTK